MICNSISLDPDAKTGCSPNSLAKFLYFKMHIGTGITIEIKNYVYELEKIFENKKVLVTIIVFHLWSSLLCCHFV